MNVVIKLIFFFSSKFKHYRVVISHWFWTKHYKGAINLDTYKISDKPLNFVTDFKSKIVIDKNVNFAGSSKLLAIDGGIIKIGKGTYFNNECSLNAMLRIEIGENCLFGEQVKIYDHNHRFNRKGELIKNQGYTLGEVKIGHNTWVGSQVVILKGVTIGDNSVIGSGCIVSKDVPCNYILYKDSAQQILQQINHK